MKLKLYQIDAFANQVFKGNSAAICPLNSWIEDSLMQKIASENNLSETGFFVKTDNGFKIRWFTPTIEVDLCGHATLAAAYVLYNFLGYDKEDVNFDSNSGFLKVTKKGDSYVLDFPIDDVKKIELTEELTKPFDVKPISVYKGKTDYVLVFDNEEIIANIKPDLEKISKIKSRGICVTSKGNYVDFVSRFFAPQSGIDEDPVTGSAHTTLTPIWTELLNKTEFSAKQISKREGELNCKNMGNRVEISGQAVTYMIGEIYI